MKSPREVKRKKMEKIRYTKVDQKKAGVVMLISACQCRNHKRHRFDPYIRNTPSDTEMNAEHQLKADRSTWPVEKNICCCC